MTIRFSELLQYANLEGGELQVEVPEDWLQGRSVFGGLQTALAQSAIRSLVPDRPFRSLQTSFIAPLAGSVRVQASVLRSGKNTTQVEAKLFGDRGLTTQVMGVLGNPLVSEVAVQQISIPDRAFATPVAFPYRPGLTPSFIQHFNMRLWKGHLPFSGSDTTEAVYELDLRDNTPATESHIVALADVVPPLGLSYLTKPTFGSTLSWMLELLGELEPDTSLKNWLVHTRLLSASGGYTHQTSTLFSPAGDAVALSRQCMLVFG